MKGDWAIREPGISAESRRGAISKSDKYRSLKHLPGPPYYPVSTEDCTELMSRALVHPFPNVDGGRTQESEDQGRQGHICDALKMSNRKY